MYLIVIFTIKQVLRCQFVEYYAIFIIPYILSDTALLIALVFSLRNKPKEINDSTGMFFVCLAAANLPIIMDLLGATLAGSDINPKVRWIASVMQVAAVPFYVVAVMNLGRNLSVLPEASALQTSGVYRFSRHPLYSTYIYWYILQVAILQSWIIVGLSIIQITLQIIRARSEERILERHFPEYATYKKQVWWIGKNLFNNMFPRV